MLAFTEGFNTPKFTWLHGLHASHESAILMSEILGLQGSVLARIS